MLQHVIGPRLITNNLRISEIILLINERVPMNNINYHKPSQFMAIKTLLVIFSTLLLSSCALTDQANDSMPHTDVNLRVPSFIQLADAANNNYNKGNSVKQTRLIPTSTLNIPIDDNSYGNLRRAIMQSQPFSDQDIKLEEIINAFPHNYPYPQGNSLFYLATEIGPAPWSDKTYLLKVGVQAASNHQARKPLNSIFLIDLSKNMNNQSGLPLVKAMLQNLVDKMSNDDTITLIGFSANPSIILEKTSGLERTKIQQAIQKLSTQAQDNKTIAFLPNLSMAYKYAFANLNADASNSIILASSGILNANIQETNEIELLVIEGYVNKNVRLNTLTFNYQNYDVNTMLHLADLGNGFHAYIDTRNEAKRIVDEKLNKMPTEFIANDINLQITFNPSFVNSYRLLGYDKTNSSNLQRNKKYLQNIPSDYSYTALYEISLSPKVMSAKKILASEIEGAFAPPPDELGSITLNYRDLTNQYPYIKQVKTALVPLQVKHSLNNNSKDFIFTTAAASLALKLNNDPYLANVSFKNIQELAQKGLDDTKPNRKTDFMQLINKLINPTPLTNQ